MITTKRITDERIIELNGIRKRPCITENGECFIVSCYRIFDDGEFIEVTDETDVNVFATEREAWQAIAMKALNYANATNQESCSVDKHTYSVRCHHVRI